MPELNDAEVTAAILLAERAVKREAAIYALKNRNAPVSLIEQANERFGAVMSEVAQNRLAEELLPQARVVVHARDHRDRYIMASLLGKCKTKIDDLCMVHSFGKSPDETDEQEQEHLMTAILAGDKKRIAAGLLLVLASIIGELLLRDDRSLLVACKTKIADLCALNGIASEYEARDDEQDHLMNSILAGDRNGVASGLYRVLDAIILDLESRPAELPPLPPEYEITVIQS